MRFGMTRLGVAVMSADCADVKRLLVTDEILERDVYGNTAAHYAIERYVNGGNNEDVCELLINTNKDIEHIPNKKKQASPHAARTPSSTHVGARKLLGSLFATSLPGGPQHHLGMLPGAS